MGMENLLKPIEAGLRIESEQAVGKEAAGRTRLDGGEEEEKEDEVVQTV